MYEDKYIGKWVSPQNDSLKEQVGRQRPMNFEEIADDISSKLEIEETNIILDVCCGNGLITKKIAEKCAKVYGVDFSEMLINTAKKKKSAKNIRYYLADARDMGRLFSVNFFDKSYLYSAFQYFNYENGKEVIELLSQVTKPDGNILIGDVPDKRRIGNYYDTYRKMSRYIVGMVKRRLKGKEGEDKLGWWWHPNKIIRICNELGLSCKILKEDENLPHSHYRFDALIINTKKGE